MAKGKRGGRRSASKSQAKTASVNTKFTAKEIKGMSRGNLEKIAKEIFIKQNTARGLSVSDADYRARSLMSGNTNAQLRKYIKKYG